MVSHYVDNMINYGKFYKYFNQIRQCLLWAMDHSVKIAEKVYDHRKVRQIDDHTKFIEDILAINCKDNWYREIDKDNWYREIDKGMEDEIEKHLLDGDFELGDVKESRRTEEE